MDAYFDELQSFGLKKINKAKLKGKYGAGRWLINEYCNILRMWNFKFIYRYIPSRNISLKEGLSAFQQINISDKLINHLVVESGIFYLKSTFVF